jgi:hypothetical protein
MDRMWGRLIPLIVASIMIAVIFVLVTVLGGIIASQLGAAGIIPFLLVVIATYAFLILTPVAVVYDHLGPTEGIAASVRAAKAGFFHILAFFIVTACLAIGVGLLAMFIAAINPYLGLVAQPAISIFFSTLTLVALTRVYAGLRREPEQARPAQTPAPFTPSSEHRPASWQDANSWR